MGGPWQHDDRTRTWATVDHRAPVNRARDRVPLPGEVTCSQRIAKAVFERGARALEGYPMTTTHAIEEELHVGLEEGVQGRLYQGQWPHPTTRRHADRLPWLRSLGRLKRSVCGHPVAGRPADAR